MTRRYDIAALCALGIGVVLAFRTPLSAMVDQWAANPMYSHGYMVPAISAWMLWAQRDRFARTTARPARLAAIPLLAIALVALVGGQLTSTQVVQQLGFVVALAAIVLFLFGFRYLALATPALAYLLFMVPFWEALTEPLHEPFQTRSAALGATLVRAIGVPAYLDDKIIALPNITLEVARECSGVNYLVAVLALALPLSWIRLDTWTRRIVLIVSSLLIAALANGVRVALIAALAYYEVGSPLHGPFHVLHGLIVAAIGYVVLFTGLWLLEPANAPTAAAPASIDLRWRTADAAGLAAAFVTIGLFGMIPMTPVALAKSLDRLPTQLGSWETALGGSSDARQVTAWAGADEHLRRAYLSPDGTVVTVDVWYFASQQQQRELIGPGTAALHRMARPHTVALADGRTLPANRVAWSDSQEIGLFWYEIHGEPEAGEYAARLKSAWQAIRDRRSDAAAVMLVATAAPGAEAQAVERLEQLAALVHGQLATHWSRTPDTTGAGQETSGD